MDSTHGASNPFAGVPESASLSQTTYFEADAPPEAEVALDLREAVDAAPAVHLQREDAVRAARRLVERVARGVP